MRVLEWGVYLIVFCLPLYLVRFRVFNIPTTALELMIYGLVLIWLVYANSNANYKRTSMRIFKLSKEILIPIVLVFVGVTVATIFSWDLRTSLGIWKAWFIDPILFFIVLISVIKNDEQIKRIFYSLLFSGLVVSVISLIYLIQGNLDVQGRLQGFYNSPNYLAMYLAPILIILLVYVGAQIICPKTRVNAPARRCAPSRPRLDRALGLRRVFLTNNPRPIFLLIINCLLLIVILFFTKSLGAWLGIVAALVFGLSVYLWKKQKKRLIWGIIFLGLVIILVFTFLKINSIQGKLSFDSRLIIWQRAWEAFRTYPITGIGPGAFRDYFPSYPRWGVPQPHNLYFAFLLQTGIIGFIGFIWLLIWFFKTGLRALFKVYSSKFIVIIVSIMVYILAHGLVDTTYWKNDLSVMFWLIIGLMAVFRN